MIIDGTRNRTHSLRWWGSIRVGIVPSRHILWLEPDKMESGVVSVVWQANWFINHFVRFTYFSLPAATDIFMCVHVKRDGGRSNSPFYPPTLPGLRSHPLFTNHNQNQINPLSPLFLSACGHCSLSCVTSHAHAITCVRTNTSQPSKQPSHRTLTWHTSQVGWRWCC